MNGDEPSGKDGPDMRTPLRSLALATLIAVTAAALAACGGPSITFVSADASYTLEEVERLPGSISRPAFDGRATAEAPDLRREALVELRGAGPEAAELAEFITRSLPTQTRAVPYYGEAATVDSVDVWIVIELWGDQDGSLDRTRTWVFTRESGDVLFSSTGS